MKLLDELKIFYGSEERKIGIYHGDLTKMRPEDAVDLLVISAYPNDYTPIPRTLIGALKKKKIDVRKLAKNKVKDQREIYSCWLSDKVFSKDPGIQFKYILCFEPYTRGEPPEVVGDIFRSLNSILDDQFSFTSIAMPLVACGDQRAEISAMVPQLIDAAVHWMSLGNFPIRNLKIVIYSEEEAILVKEIFSNLKERYLEPPIKTESKKSYKYDIFISYSQENKDDIDFFVEELNKKFANLQIFLDRIKINTGSAWQAEIDEAIENSKKIIPFYSPQYLKSPICQEEFHMARHRRREDDPDLLFPIYLYECIHPPLGRFMKIITYRDCTNGDREKMINAIEEIDF